MCRCDSGSMPVPTLDLESDVQDTGIVQESSLATSLAKMHFFVRKTTCECKPSLGEKTRDQYLQSISRLYCAPPPKDSNLSWDRLPDFGVQQKLPLFLGVLSYKSPRSLESSINNWVQGGIDTLGLQGTFVQLNGRSRLDDEVLARHSYFNFTATGHSSENIHPGLAIARFCRAAEKSPNSHPRGENLLLFLEKDWHFTRPVSKTKSDLSALLHSINSLAQRGVPYTRLSAKLTSTSDSDHASWRCDAEGISWECVTAHQQRYTNLPSVLRCDWFLRYLEPFALIEDSIMFGCRNSFRQKRYFDWEEAMQDGRVAWTNSQWVVANKPGPPMFRHVEVDQ